MTASDTAPHDGVAQVGHPSAPTRTGGGRTASPRSLRLSTTAAAALAASILVATRPAAAVEPTAPNVMRLVMRTPRGGFDRMVVSVVVCEPNTERCATIDDVMVDTGSTGLRLEASAVPAWLRLPPFVGPDRRPIAECLRFVHDTAWGPLRLADVRLGGLTARALPLQIVDDNGGPQPASCPRSDARPTSNGTLGVGQHLFDCQGDCEQDTAAPGVFVAFVQAYKAKGARLVGQPTEGFGIADEALAAARRLARWRVGIVVFRQDVDDDGIQYGRPAVLAVHGQVPDGWLMAGEAAA